MSSPHPGFVQGAIDRAVTTYMTVRQLPGPESAAAFGWACKELMEALDCNLGAAAALLKAELDRKAIP